MIRKRLAVLALSAMMVLSGSISAFAALDTGAWDSGNTYPQDVLNTDLLTPVKYLMDKKVLTGYEDGLFHADRSITRAEFATIMAKATNNINELDILKEKNYFNDITSQYDWAKGYINACAKANLIKGVSETAFAPEKEVTYAEVITVIIRSKNVSEAEIGGYGSWPNNYITYAQMYGMLGSVTVTNWNAPATRGDVAKLVYRSMPKSSDDE